MSSPARSNQDVKRTHWRNESYKMSPKQRQSAVTALASPAYISSIIFLLSIIPLTICATTTTTTSSPSLAPLNNNDSRNRTVQTRLEFKEDASSRPTSVRATTTTTTHGASSTSVTVRANSTIASKKKLGGDYQGSASLLRPSFIRNLLKPHKGHKKQAAAASADDEEEVTQTIMVPVNPEDAQQPPEERRQQHWSVATGPAAPSIKKHKGAMAHSIKLEAEADAPEKSLEKEGEQSILQPSAEASLRLTSTEIGGLLNDREAPEFYRERELGGDGISVAEEPAHAAAASKSSPSDDASGPPAQLGTAASGPFGSHFMGDYGGTGGGGFGMGGSDAAALYHHRLAQAASEGGEYGGPSGGFDHRFGQQSFGTSEDAFGSAGGLMRSPNEYSEVSNYGAGGFAAGAAQHLGGGGDFSPHSGLLRAGSGEGGYGGFGGAGSMMGGEFGGHGGQSEFAGGQGGFYGDGGGGGRLQAHASYNPYMQSAGGAEADYASRFGQQYGGGGGGMMGGGSFGLDQRGFASQKRLSRLMPLTPVVPLAEELSSSSSPGGVTQPSVLSSNQREGQMYQQQQQQAMRAPASSNQQVHEPLEDDPTDVSAADEASTLSGASEHQQRQHALQQHYEGAAGGTEESQDGVGAASVSQQENQFVGQTGGGGGSGGGEHTMVLNVPPQTDEQPTSYSMRSGSQMVEFSRVGSAGYLGPSARPNRGPQMMLAKKSGHHHRAAAAAAAQEQSGESEDEEQGAADDDSATGANNPAHAGKYIID